MNVKDYLDLYSPFCVTAKVIKLVGLKNGGRLSPTNLITFAGTQNGEYSFSCFFSKPSSFLFFEYLSKNRKFQNCESDLYKHIVKYSKKALEPLKKQEKIKNRVFRIFS